MDFETFDEWAEMLIAMKATALRNAVRTAPSDEPLSWNDRRTRLVRLDVAILACHLFAVRVGVKSIPGVIRQRLQKTAEAAAGVVLAIAGMKSVTFKLLGAILKPFKVVFDLWRAEKAQIEIENAVRRNAIRTLRELYLFRLSQRTKVRRRRRVLTRHPIPKQRRPNGYRARH